MFTLSSLNHYIHQLTSYLIQELAGIIKLPTFSSFSLFECHKVVTGSKSPDTGNGKSFFYSLLVDFIKLTETSSLTTLLLLTQRSTLD